MSSEKNDVKLPESTADAARKRRTSKGVNVSPGAWPTERSLRCVWTRHLHDGRSCGSHVPLATVRAAWQRELARGRAGAGGFFHFAWRGEAWLAYGLADGEVRGVYCPAHRAQREERLGYDPELAAPAAASPAAALGHAG
jgi:hypothetical protein